MVLGWDSVGMQCDYDMLRGSGSARDGSTATTNTSRASKVKNSKAASSLQKKSCCIQQPPIGPIFSSPGTGQVRSQETAAAIFSVAMASLPSRSSALGRKSLVDPGAER